MQLKHLGKNSMMNSIQFIKKKKRGGVVGIEEPWLDIAEDGMDTRSSSYYSLSMLSHTPAIY